MPNLARAGSARSENSSGEQFGVASRAITPWTRDGSLIAAHNMLWVLWLLWGLLYGLLCPESHNTITITVSLGPNKGERETNKAKGRGVALHTQSNCSENT